MFYCFHTGIGFGLNRKVLGGINAYIPFIFGCPVELKTRYLVNVH